MTTTNDIKTKHQYPSIARLHRMINKNIMPRDTISSAARGHPTTAKSIVDGAFQPRLEGEVEENKE